jgi:acetylglutamate/LysW-gamma-L-alpha-aminoadipate kinase
MNDNRTTTPTIVIKCGGTAAVDADAICEDVAELAGQGLRVIVVHGGSAEIERLAGLLGVPQRRQTAPDGISARHTDERTLEVVTMALAGTVKPRLVRCLVNRGVRAIGLTGVDAGLLRARRKKAQRAVVDGRIVMVRDNRAGVVEAVDGRLLQDLLNGGGVPVISPPAVTADGELVNVDADRTAAAVAGAVHADLLVLLTGAAGVQRDPADERSMMRQCTVPRQGRPAQWARGGMALKLVAAREALAGGVGRVLIADGRRRHPVRQAMAGDCTDIHLEAAEPAGPVPAAVA